MRQVSLHNQTHPFSEPIQAGYCHTFWCRFRGLMLAPALADRHGLLLVEKSESRVNAAIHMLFMRFDIAVIWMDANLRVVDCALARRWRPSYAPTLPAQYTLETRPEYLSEFHIGDQILLEQ